MKNIIIAVVSIVFIFSITFFGGQWLQKKQSPEVLNVERIQAHKNCDPTQHPCEINVTSHSVFINFLSEPSALKPFSVLVQTEIENLQQVGLRFYMQGMSMGYNTFELRKVKNTQWQSDIVLPVCSTGSKDWHVELQLLFDKRLVISDFYFKQKN